MGPCQGRESRSTQLPFGGHAADIDARGSPLYRRVQAHDRARRVHQAFLAEYGLSASKFPLLRLSPTMWDAPFAAA